MIKNKPRINEDPKDALLRKKQDELQILKAQIRKMALKCDPHAMRKVAAGLGTQLNSKTQQKNKKVDLSEIEKENMRVLEDKENLTKDLRRKKEQ